MKPYICYLGLGANLGHREETLQRALEEIAGHPHIVVEKISSFYETPPWGKLDQPSFINAVAELSVDLPPGDLLMFCQKIEQEFGRVRKEKWGPRTLDLDLLYIPGQVIQSACLSVPHPYLLERAFVLVPLAEIAGNLLIRGKTVAQWCSSRGFSRVKA